MARLGWAVIVNADDYGMTDGVSRAILRAHHDGIVTATSAMPVGPAFARAAPWLDDVPDLAVGLHLAAVGEDPPLLCAAEIPSLVDRDGSFASLSSLRAAPRLALGQVDPADLEREFQAQFDAFVAATGRHPTHVDTHHNLHLWPSVGRVVAALAERWAVPVVRRPWSRRHGPTGSGVRSLGRRLGHTLTAHGLAPPDLFYGIDEGGRIDTAALVRLLYALRGVPVPHPAAVAEIAVHPGEAGDPALARYPWPGARRDLECEALTSDAARVAVTAAGFTLVTPGSVHEARRPRTSTAGRATDAPETPDGAPREHVAPATTARPPD